MDNRNTEFSVILVHFGRPLIIILHVCTHLGPGHSKVNKEFNSSKEKKGPTLNRYEKIDPFCFASYFDNACWRSRSLVKFVAVLFKMKKKMPKIKRSSSSSSVLFWREREKCLQHFSNFFFSLLLLLSVFGDGMW